MYDNNENIKKIVVSNLAWRFFERVGAQIVTIIVTIVLARIMGPSAYGKVSLINVIVSILTIFIDSGMGNALIQKKDSDELDFSSVFYFNIVICIALYFTVFAISPFVAAFYDDTSFVSLIRVSALVLMVSGLKNIQQAYVIKNMLFKKFFFATLIGTVASAIVGVTMALKGFGVWSIVAQQLVNPVVDTAILWITIKWRPIKKCSIERLKALFSYGWKLLASSLLQTSYNKIFQLAIGKSISPSELAYYEKGQQFPQVIYSNIVTSVDSVLFPVLSQKQDSMEIIKNAARRSIKVETYLMAPIMIGMISISDYIILFLFGQDWMQASMYLKVVAIAGLIAPLTTTCNNAIKSIGRSDVLLRNEIIQNILYLVMLFCFIGYGRNYLLFSVIVAAFFSFVLAMLAVSRFINYTGRELIKDIFMNIVNSLIMGLVVYLVIINLYFVLFLKVLMGIIIGAGIYILISAITNNDSFNYIKQIVFQYLKKEE